MPVPQDDDGSMSSGDESDNGDLTDQERTDSEYMISPGASNITSDSRDLRVNA